MTTGRAVSSTTSKDDRSDSPAPIEAHEANLADYLNQPVHDILSRLGVAVPAVPGQPPPSDMARAADGTMPAGQANPFDPSQMIQPVTDALGTLGSGLFGDADPTKMFAGISKSLESAGQFVHQALVDVAGSWDGAASNAAETRTTSALNDGAKVADQAEGLGSSLSLASTSVQQGRVQLIAIIEEFFATIAAIGPSIVFPWGLAAAIAAASRAVASATAVITGLQADLSAEAGHVSAIGAPVAMSAAPGILAQVVPLTQMAGGLAGPIVQAITSATQAAQDGGATPSGGAAADREIEGPLGGPSGTGPRGILGGGGPPGASAVPVTPQARLTAPASAVAAAETSAATTQAAAPKSGPVGLGGSPMMGGGPAARNDADGIHNAASFLHTSDQGDEIIGDLGTAAPPVIGELEMNPSHDIELRI